VVYSRNDVSAVLGMRDQILSLRVDENGNLQTRPEQPLLPLRTLFPTAFRLATDAWRLAKRSMGLCQDPSIPSTAAEYPGRTHRRSNCLHHEGLLAPELIRYLIVLSRNCQNGSSNSTPIPPSAAGKGPEVTRPIIKPALSKVYSRGRPVLRVAPQGRCYTRF
jgi:hypothetical protein